MTTEIERRDFFLGLFFPALAAGVTIPGVKLLEPKEAGLPPGDYKVTIIDLDGNDHEQLITFRMTKDFADVNIYQRLRNGDLVQAKVSNLQLLQELKA